MNIDSVRACCKALPRVTEDVQWDNQLLFRVARKIFCVVALEPASVTKIVFKCTPEKFAELVEQEGIVPAPYMARNHWVALTNWTALRDAELRECLGESYQLVVSKLSKKLQRKLSLPGIVR